MSSEFLTNATGAAAAFLSVTSFVPQIIKMVQTRDVSAVSVRTYALTVSCFTLWVIYGIRLRAWPITIANALALMMSGAILMLKWRYDRRERAV